MMGPLSELHFQRKTIPIHTSPMVGFTTQAAASCLSIIIDSGWYSTVSAKNVKKKKKATVNFEHVMLSVIEEQPHILSLAAPLALTLHPPGPGDRSFYDRIGLWPTYWTDYWSFHLAGVTLTYCANNFADGN